MGISEHDEQLAKIRRLARLIREEPQWALSRVMRAAELEASLQPQRGAVAPGEYTCPNGHRFPEVFDVGCAECEARIACEPVAKGMALARQPQRGAVAAPVGYELVRVAREVLEQLLTQVPQPVVVIGFERYEDGTVELVFRTPTQQCPICGAFIPKPGDGDRARSCARCGTEFEVPPPDERGGRIGRRR